MDNSLRVDPAALIDGAQHFRETHQGLRAVLATIQTGADNLHGKWTGTAADKGSAMWSDLHAAFGAHVDLLDEHADKLHTAAGLYRRTDAASGSDIERQM